MAKQTKTSEKFTLIVLETSVTSSKADPGGGEEHSLFSGKTIQKIVPKSLDFDKVKENFDKCLAQTNDLLENAAKKIVSNWEIGEITISLALTGEGSVGFATVGVEAGIEIKLIPKNK